MPSREEQRTPASSSELRQEAEEVCRRLHEAGYEALFAGGCVRDLTLGLDPIDFDIATSARPDDVAALFPRTVPVGAHFGVTLVVMEKASFEVTTFRSDGDYLDHRRPSQVTFSDARGDAARRDFTINGMFLDPRSGDLIDYVDGQKDLAAGVVRAIGDPEERFREDRLRMMRAVRFSARFRATIEPATFAAVQASAPQILDIAWERIGDELRKILADGEAARALTLLDQTGLLERILPEVHAMKGVEQSPEHHPEGDVFTHTRLALASLEADHDDALCLAVLLHDIAKPLCAESGKDGRIRFHGHCERGGVMAREICERLRYSNAIRDKVGWLVTNHLRHLDARQMRVSTLKRFLAEPFFDDLLELIRIDALAGSGDLELWHFLRNCREEFSQAGVAPPPILRGRDLLALGYTAGPGMREILDAIYDAQLEQIFQDEEGARHWVLQAFPPPPSSPPS